MKSNELLKGMLSKRENNRKIINYPYVTFFGHMRYQVGRSWQITEQQLKGYQVIC